MNENAAKTKELASAARTVGALVRGQRLTFRQSYDAILDDLARPELPQSFLHALVIAERRLRGVEIETFDPMLDRDAFALALLALGNAEALLNVAIAMVALGLFDEADQSEVSAVAKHRAATASTIRTSLGFSTQARPQRSTAEVILDPKATWVDPALLSPAILLACRRVCRVSSRDANGKPITGTGFLVGPSAVMTNWHVVKDFLPEMSEKLDPGLLTVHFDSLRSGFPGGRETVVAVRLDNWLLAKSEMGDLAPADASDGWWQDVARRKTWQQGLAGKLDFAVIALDAAPGEQRGWYDLARIATVQPDGSCFVFHHPSGLPMAVTGGTIIHADGLRPVRIFHTASTRGGSSGGLIVDDNGVPTALHHAGHGDDGPRGNGRAPRVPEEAINVAVPLSAIRQAIDPGTLKSITAEARLSLPKACLDGRSPVFGRSELVKAIDAVAAGERRILWIKPPESGPKRPGKSFSIEVIKALLPPPRNIYIELTADRVKAGGSEMAKLILETLSKGGSAALPNPSDSGTTETAFYENQLVSFLRDRITADFAANLVWLIIDDLDVHTLTDAGGRRFLDALYKRAREIAQLRIVLVGLKVALPGIPEDVLRPSPIDGMEMNDLGQLVQRWLNARGARDKPIDIKVMRLIGDMLASYAGSDAPLENLANFARQHLADPLDTFLAD